MTSPDSGWTFIQDAPLFRMDLSSFSSHDANCRLPYLSGGRSNRRKHRHPVIDSRPSPAPNNWAAAKDLHSSYHDSEAQLFGKYPHSGTFHGNINKGPGPRQTPWNLKKSSG